MFEGEGGSYYSWSSKEFAVLGEAMVGAGLLVLKPGGFALPHCADSSKLGYVLQVSWWYNHGNSNCVIAFLGETSKAYIPGEFTYFLLTGTLGILGGFSTEFTSKALHINQNEANILAKSQTGVLIVKLDPEDRNKIPQPHQNINIVNKYVKNILRYSPDIHVDRAGEATSFTEKNFPILEEIGVSCSLVKLETDAMLSPLYTCVSSVQVFYVVKGTAKVEIVGMNGKLVLDNKIVAGQVVVVPRFFTIGVVAQDQGMECFSITTTSRLADVVNFWWPPKTDKEETSSELHYRG
ncbi:hypothetical protein Q3G72_020793 [Acer saccharum]|nr:hypothetical protein Q3G72_020793 [Acer saccharum]